MTKQTTHFGTNYRSLNDIRLCKAQLHTGSTKGSNKIAGLWNELMHRPKGKNTPTQRFSGTLNVGAGVLNELVLTWKLYRMFSGKQSSSPFNNKSGLFKRKKKQVRRQPNKLWKLPVDKHYSYH